ncbi:transcriptional regulator, DeoR family [Caldanaerobius fijiensis DSM 17918]|uniref:Transcriptional regulator, DeoR family n=1 Tax=Caldanaerobius fijiensis DSM 17918 TaxID=1121256 RepID=A0A1M4VZX1_9THEO|nr:DeoR/GlpR family DNA-binding transcription regulator [Caldanaerobius fijiensis]SHE74528.1 transcriptional regulator, DeoR family [Caldanaerobius fijiensis DSM 17918]
MIAASRKREIKRIITEKKYVKVNELSRLFNVSEETIRRDLEALENEGILERNYGGAVLVESATVPPLSIRAAENLEEKRLIGEKAVQLIKEGSIILLDAGTTTFQIAKKLENKRMTVITNDINIAYELKDKNAINVFITGGKLSGEVMALYGPETQKSIEGYNVDIAFIATTGITLTKGFTTSDIYGAEVKKSMIRAAREKIIVADSSKIGKNALITFASFSDIDCLILAGSVDEDVLHRLEEMIKVVMC